MSLARILREARTTKARERVIVLLRDEHLALPATRSDVAAREAVLRAARHPVEAMVRRSGGRVRASFDTLNAFAATVSSAERQALVRSSDVAAVVPDTVVRDPFAAPGGGLARARRGAPAGSSPGVQTNASGQQICPASPSRPLVEPEALALVHGDQVQQLGIDGRGVRVGVMTDGINPDNPDFIRPDGSHAVVDYRDFTGDGPNAATVGGEAYLDVSSIAAQGRIVHDLSQYVDPSHALPVGCNIVIRGMAPGASVAVMKVFTGFGGSPISTIIQGLDWLVAHDHVDVLNESFGALDVPDVDQDVIKQFNRLAAASGTTVVSSTGDSGTNSTIASPASDPSTVAVGATTQLQYDAQVGGAAYPVSPHGWLDDNIADFSSAGYTQGGRTLDLVAPGEFGWVDCDANPEFAFCVNEDGNPLNFEAAGGTSESAPLTSGAAADVIEAYRNAHQGASPPPGLVKALITSNAADLDLPSDEQGAGELDALAAVRAAAGGRSAVGRAITPSQLDLAEPQGTTAQAAVHVTNLAATAQTFTAHLRGLGTPSHTTGTVTLNPASDPKFANEEGLPEGYRTVHLTMPTGVDRLDVALAWPAPAAPVTVTLFDPSGKLANTTTPEAGAPSGYGNVDVRSPAAGVWTAVVFTPADGTGFTGQVRYDATTQAFGPAGTVSPSSITLAPGAGANLQVSLAVPSAAGDYSRDLQIVGSAGQTSVVPVVLRSVMTPGPSGLMKTFAGTITGGNGVGLAQESTVAFDVPSGSPAIDAEIAPTAETNTSLFAVLVAPDGQSLAQAYAPAQPGSTPPLQMFARDPEPGRWRIVLTVYNPVGGTATAIPYRGYVDLRAPQVTASGVPDSTQTTVTTGDKAHATVTVTNPTPTDLSLIIDPRRTQRALYSLTAYSQATGVTLPLSGPSPFFLMPTQSDEAIAAAHASAPVTFDWGFFDPDLEATSAGDSAAGVQAAAELGPGGWLLNPSLIGPFNGPASGTVDTGMAAHTRIFDPDVTSSTGDPQVQFVDADASAGTPLDVPPGATAHISVTFAPTETRAQTVQGDLFVDDFQPNTGVPGEIASIPYAFRVTPARRGH